MKFLKLTIASLLVLGVIFFVQRKNSNDTREECFVVGMSGGYAPWVSLNPEGEYEGFDIDVARELAKKMNKKLRLQDLGSMPSLFLALDQGKIDAIIWGISITKERAARMEMIKYQGDVVDCYPLLFWKKLPSKGIEGLQGLTICVEVGSSQEKALLAYPQIIPKYISRVDDGLLAIQYGKADAILVEPALAKKFSSKLSEIKILELPISEALQETGVGICLKKGTSSLKNLITEVIADLDKDGVLKKLEAKWSI